jgi:hypothetical protein
VFYFQQLLNTALAGIDGTAIISTVTNFAFAILLIGFLIGLYQAAFRGGDFPFPESASWGRYMP